MAGSVAFSAGHHILRSTLTLKRRVTLSVEIVPHHAWLKHQDSAWREEKIWWERGGKRIEDMSCL